MKEKRNDLVRVSFFLIGGLPMTGCGSETTFSFSGVGERAGTSRRMSSAKALISAQASAVKERKKRRMNF